MEWECLNCGNRQNSEDVLACMQCGMEKYLASTMVVVKARRSCLECGHIHREGLFCHVYVEAADANFENEADIDASIDDTNTDSDSEDASSLGLSQSKAPKFAKIRILPTPLHIKKMGYVRCNCDIGVPRDSRFYEPIPRHILVGEIRVQSYEEIADQHERKKFLASLVRRNSDPLLILQKQEKLLDFARQIPRILSFLALGECSPAAVVNKNWNYGANMYKEYTDMRDCFPWQAYRPHNSQVYAILVHRGKVYSTGDKRLVVSDIYAGQVIQVVTRDSGDILCLQELNEEIYSCSTNGSIRTFGVTHTGLNMPMISTMWDHTRSINSIVFVRPSVGICKMHGIQNHVCMMLTASDDRTIRLWNVSKKVCFKAISSSVLKTMTIMKVTLSDRHIFAGTSEASVAIFSLHNICEREDLHMCNNINYDKTYCLQLTLKLPLKLMRNQLPSSVTSLICSGNQDDYYNNEDSYSFLWAGDSTGQLNVWSIPTSGLEFRPAFTIKAHDGSINDLRRTHKHMLSIGDDGMLIIFNLFSFVKIRRTNILEWCIHKGLSEKYDIPRKIKSIGFELDEINGGTLAVGTSYGDVIIMSLGTTI
eukprot:gene13209-17702_t